MPAQVVERALGGGDHLDVEALEEGARPVFRTGERLRDGVVGEVRGLGGQAPLEAEEGREGVVEPGPGRGAAEEMVVLREEAPDPTPVGLNGPAVTPAHAEVLESHALAVQHPEDVVVRHDEEPGRIGKGLVLRVPARVGMPVRRDDGEVAHLVVEPQRHPSSDGIRGKEPVLVDEHGHTLRRWLRASPGQTSMEVLPAAKASP